MTSLPIDLPPSDPISPRYREAMTYKYGTERTTRPFDSTEFISSLRLRRLEDFLYLTLCEEIMSLVALNRQTDGHTWGQKNKQFPFPSYLSICNIPFRTLEFEERDKNYARRRDKLNLCFYLKASF